MYYVRQRTTVSGPFPAEVVRSQLYRGLVARSDKVSTDKASWQSIAETPEIIERPQAVGPEDSETASQPAEVDNRLWHYALAGQPQRVPISTASIERLIRTGQVNASDLVWTDGFGIHWRNVAEVPEFADLFGDRDLGADPPQPRQDEFPELKDLRPKKRRKRKGGWL